MQEPILKFIELYESLALVKRDYLDKNKISSNLYKIVELVSSSRGKKFENRESLYLTKLLTNKYNRFNPPNPSDLIHALELIDRLRERRKIKGDIIADKNNPFNPDQPFPTLLNNLNKEFVVGKHVAKNPNERIDFKNLGLREGKDYNLIYDKNNIQVLQLLTFESTKIIKDVTNWCIQHKGNWDFYQITKIKIFLVVNYNFNENDYRKYCAINLEEFGDIVEFKNSQQEIHTDPSKLIEMPEYTKGQEKAALAYLKQFNIPFKIFDKFKKEISEKDIEDFLKMLKKYSISIDGEVKEIYKLMLKTGHYKNFSSGCFSDGILKEEEESDQPTLFFKGKLNNGMLNYDHHFTVFLNLSVTAYNTTIDYNGLIPTISAKNCRINKIITEECDIENSEIKHITFSDGLDFDGSEEPKISIKNSIIRSIEPENKQNVFLEGCTIILKKTSLSLSLKSCKDCKFKGKSTPLEMETRRIENCVFENCNILKLFCYGTISAKFINCYIESFNNDLKHDLEFKDCKILYDPNNYIFFYANFENCEFMIKTDTIEGLNKFYNKKEFSIKADSRLTFINKIEEIETTIASDASDINKKITINGIIN